MFPRDAKCEKSIISEGNHANKIEWMFTIEIEKCLFTMKCTHLYLKIVRIPLKMVDEIFFKDFNVNFIDNCQKMVELL